jgi:hypothetical protein
MATRLRLGSGGTTGGLPCRKMSVRLLATALADALQSTHFEAIALISAGSGADRGIVLRHPVGRLAEDARARDCRS